MKLPENSKTQLSADTIYLGKKTSITKFQLEDEIENLYTTRSCPTGYKEKELKKSTNEELLSLRDMTFEYLKFRSSKTRNVEFIHLVKRINSELSERGLNTNITITYPEYAKSKELCNTVFSGEYTLTKKLASCLRDIEIDLLQSDGMSQFFSDSDIKYLKSKERNFLICTKYFTVKPPKKMSIPDFLNDKPEKVDHEEENSLSLSEHTTTKGFSKQSNINDLLKLTSSTQMSSNISENKSENSDLSLPKINQVSNFVNTNNEKLVNKSSIFSSLQELQEFENLFK